MVITPLRGDLLALREVQAPQQIQEADDRDGGYRVSSAAFGPGSDKTVSVDLEESLIAAGLSITHRFPSMQRAVALVSLPVSVIVSKGLAVRHDPIPSNPHHGVITDGDIPLSKRQRRDAARMLADEARIVVPFDLAEIAKHIAAAS